MRRWAVVVWGAMVCAGCGVGGAGQGDGRVGSIFEHEQYAAWRGWTAAPERPAAPAWSGVRVFGTWRVVDAGMRERAWAAISAALQSVRVDPRAAQDAEALGLVLATLDPGAPGPPVRLDVAFLVERAETPRWEGLAVRLSRQLERGIEPTLTVALRRREGDPAPADITAWASPGAAQGAPLTARWSAPDTLTIERGLIVPPPHPPASPPHATPAALELSVLTRALWTPLTGAAYAQPTLALDPRPTYTSRAPQAMGWPQGPRRLEETLSDTAFTPSEEEGGL